MENSSESVKRVLSRSQHFVGDAIGEDTILIDTLTGAYYSLTQGAGALWQLLEGGPAAVPDEFVREATVLLREGVLTAEGSPAVDSTDIPDDIAFVKYTDMSDILLADPIHDVDDQGWPVIR